MSSPTTGAGEVTPREPLVSVVVPSIGSTGTVQGHTRAFAVEAVRSVLATAGVPVEGGGVSGREMPAAVEASLPAPTDAPVEMLGQLKRMLEGGLITAEEYDAKKKELLSRL